jgi:hypothetical protein
MQKERGITVVHAQPVHGIWGLYKAVEFLFCVEVVVLSSVMKCQRNFCYIVTPFCGFKFHWCIYTSRAGVQASQHCMFLGFLQTFTLAVIPAAELTNLQRRE